jgi:L-tartrate/succinate antiporter
MWTALATTCVTSSLSLTALAPNLLALELTRKAVNIDITWMQWFTAFLPVGIILLLAVPLLTYMLYPPEVKQGKEVPAWAAQELARMGRLSWQEIILAVLVSLALLLWIFGGDFIDATTVALAVISLMLLSGVVTWNDMLDNKQAWNTLAWFATLVTLAGGLSRVGFVAWFAQVVSGLLTGITPTTAMVALVAVFFLVHYLFASVTAHVTALLPVFLAAGSGIPGLPLSVYALLLLVSLGIMGIISPYGTGPSPVYYGSGYLPASDFWRLGGIFGAIYLIMLLVVGVPYLLALFG